MKKGIQILALVSLVFGSTFVLAQQQQPQPNLTLTTQSLDALSAQLRTLLNANNVMTNPIEYENMRIIPIVNYGFFFGVGSGQANAQTGGGIGSGAGAGGGVMPASFLVLKADGTVQVFEAQHGTLSDVVKAIAPNAAQAIRGNQQQGGQGQQQGAQGQGQGQQPGGQGQQPGSQGQQPRGQSQGQP
jgi:uncharacterized spore protein YtfJ